MNIITSIDYGTKHIGIAIGQKITKTAKPLKTLTKKLLLKKIKTITKKWHSNTIILGVPDEKQTPKKFLTELNKFKKNLEICNYKVYIVTEHLTTWESKKIKKNNLKDFNSLSATIILQNWLNSN
jgi:putative Holliday junction resolvase